MNFTTGARISEDCSGVDDVVVDRHESGMVVMQDTLKPGEQTAKHSTASIDKDTMSANKRNSVVLGLKQEI